MEVYGPMRLLCDVRYVLDYGGLWSYALAMRCPVLTSAMLRRIFCDYSTGISQPQVPTPFSLRACYAMSGTGWACGTLFGVFLCPRYAMSGTEIAYGATRGCVPGPPSQLPYLVSPYALRVSYAMSGSDIAYDASSLRSCYAVSGTDLAYGATRPELLRQYLRMLQLEYQRCSTSLRACYAMSDTGLRAMLLRACYAITGTDDAYGATSTRA
eukprot:560421-Rhodomonas_salina.2